MKLNQHGTSLLLALALAMLGVGCGSDDELPTAPEEFIIESTGRTLAWTADGQDIMYSQSCLWPNCDWVPILIGPEHRELVPASLGLRRMSGMAMSPDGTTLAITAYDTLGSDNREIFLISLTDLQISRVTRTSRIERSLSWSPDGRRLMTQSSDTLSSRIEIIDLSDMRTVVVPGCPEDVSAPSWSPDGTRIAFIAETAYGSTEIHTINVDGSGLLQITREGGLFPVYGTISWSPEGDRILSGNRVVDVQDGLVVNLGISRECTKWSPTENRIAYTASWGWGGRCIKVLEVE